MLATIVNKTNNSKIFLSTSNLNPNAAILDIADKINLTDILKFELPLSIA